MKTVPSKRRTDNLVLLPRGVALTIRLSVAFLCFVNQIEIRIITSSELSDFSTKHNMAHPHSAWPLLFEAIRVPTVAFHLPQCLSTSNQTP